VSSNQALSNQSSKSAIEEDAVFATEEDTAKQICFLVEYVFNQFSSLNQFT
jgi:hypothetical protein